MLQLGYGHGDLHMGNIGFDEKNNIFILDHDTMYKIDEGETEWLNRWINKAYDDVESFEEFVNYDYVNWRSDWLH